MSIFAVKMTFLFQYYRVLAINNMRRVYLATMVVVGGWSVSQIVLQFVLCIPLSKFWQFTPGGTCIPNYPYRYVNAAGNIITDIMVFLLPLPALYAP